MKHLKHATVHCQALLASSIASPVQVTSLRRLLDNDMLDQLARITEISDSASREWSIEKALDKMEADWEGLTFELGEWKSTGTYILKGKARNMMKERVIPSCAVATVRISCRSSTTLWHEDACAVASCQQDCVHLGYMPLRLHPVPTCYHCWPAV